MSVFIIRVSNRNKIIFSFGRAPLRDKLRLAQAEARSRKQTLWFVFNGVTVRVKPSSDIGRLHEECKRTQGTSRKEVGP